MRGKMVETQVMRAEFVNNDNLIMNYNTLFNAHWKPVQTEQGLRMKRSSITEADSWPGGRSQNKFHCVPNMFVMFHHVQEHYVKYLS